MKAFLCFVITIVMSFNLTAETLIMKADEWCPYNCNPKDSNLGYMVDIAKAIFEPAGHKIEYQILTWARAKVEASEGSF